MKKPVLAALLLATATLTAHGDKPFSPDTQITLLKAQRDIQQQQIKIADLQRQFDQATITIKQLQADMETNAPAPPRWPTST